MDPWGAVIAECSDKADVAIAEIDLDYLHKRRTEMPVTEHRRTDLYGSIYLNQMCRLLLTIVQLEHRLFVTDIIGTTSQLFRDSNYHTTLDSDE